MMWLRYAIDISKTDIESKCSPMTNSAQQLLENEKARLNRSIAQMERDAQKDPDRSLDDGEGRRLELQKSHLEFVEHLQERVDDLDDLVQTCRMYLLEAEERHRESDPDGTGLRNNDWRQSLNEIYYISYLMDEALVERNETRTNFTPETSDSPSGRQTTSAEVLGEE